MIEWFKEFVYEPLVLLTEEQFRAIIFIILIVKVIDSIQHFGNMCFQKAIEIRNRCRDY